MAVLPVVIALVGAPAKAITNYYHAASCYEEGLGGDLELDAEYGWQNPDTSMHYVVCAIATDGDLGKDASDVTDIDLFVQGNGMAWSIKLCYEDPDSFTTTCGATYQNTPSGNTWLYSGSQLTLYSGATAWDNVVVVIGIPQGAYPLTQATFKSLAITW
jgi:hypothetical protein